MQPVSPIYEELYRSQKYYMETSLVVGDAGVLITEKAERILFPHPVYGDVAILVSSGGVDSGYGETMLISVKTTKRVFKNNVPEVGCCPCGEIYVEMHQPKGFIPRKAAIIPYIRLVSTEDHNVTSEWLRKGVFYVDTRDNTNNDDNLDILTMHGYDAMMYAEQPYGEFFQEEEFTIEFSNWTKSAGTYTATVNNAAVVNSKEVTVEYTGDDSIAFGQSVTYTQISGGVRFTTQSAPPPNLFGKLVLREKNTLGFPATDVDVVLDIASKMGVDVDPRTIAVEWDIEQEKYVPKPKEEQPYLNMGFTIQYPSEYTMREVLGYIGAMYGGNWVMNDLGQLQFIALWDLPVETELITDELGYRLVFGSDDGAARIKVHRVG